MIQQVIKVRGWDEETKEMLHPVDLSAPLATFDWLGKKDVPLMLFINKCDRYGNEIYVGDIVMNGLSGTWIVRPLENGSMSLLGICNQYKDRNFSIDALNRNVEILGDIFRNPELIPSEHRQYLEQNGAKV